MARLLLVEDDKLLGKAIKEELEESGYEIEVTPNGQNAADLLNQSHYDLIFLDIMLQGDYDGFDVLKAIRAPESNYKTTPVIMLSNLGQLENIDRAMDMGATDYIVKASTDLSKIVELTQKYLDVHRAKQSVQ